MLLAFLKENNVLPKQWENFETWEDAKFDDWENFFNTEDMVLEFFMSIETDASFDYDGPCGTQTHHQSCRDIDECTITLISFHFDDYQENGKWKDVKLKNPLDITDFFSNKKFDEYCDWVSDHIFN